MRVITQTSEFRKLAGPVILAAGFFDGLHKGHQLVISSAVERAAELAGQAWVLTFDRHPLSLLAPSKVPPLLTTLEERLALMESLGVAGALVLPFTRQLAVVDPESFVRRMCGATTRARSESTRIQCHSGLSEIRCGRNWRFGKRAAGNPGLLAQLGAQYGFRVVIMPYAMYQEMEISSTRIRCAIREGRLADANAMLGRAYSVRGTVLRGRGIGRSLEAATANMRPTAEVLPPNGVYAVRAKTPAGVRNGVANLGFRPTFADALPEQAELETHLLDFTGDLYGTELEVHFLARLRAEIVFTSVEALKRQIKIDITRAQRYFE